MTLPPVIWLAGEPGFDQWQWVRGVMAAHRAGCVRQVLAVERGLPHPNVQLGGRVEVLELDAGQRRSHPGMLGTLQLGLAHLGDRDPGPVFLALASRPLARAETYRALYEELGRSQAVVVKPCSGGKSGHPILLGVEARLRAGRLDAATQQVRDLVREPRSLNVEDPGVLAS